jgi:tetratricopeptide (TPR) repeat protein
LAAITDPQGRIRGLEGEVAGLNGTLKQRWGPDQMLTFWMPLLRERGRNDLADKAIIDADRVLKEAKASPQDKARAHAVKGIALRNEGKYAEAKTELEQAKINLPKEDAVWRSETEAALKEASDPSAYFAARAETFRKEGQITQALAMLNRALETAAPQTRASLIVERGALRLEQALAHGNGRAAANDPDLITARKDADEAKKGGGADAFYLSGRIAEQLGQTDEALQDYRQALKAHGALDADGARYRAALARMLILPRTAAPARIGKGEGAPSPDVLVALIAVGVQPGEFAGPIDPATQEAVKLADEILSAKESDVPFEARAQAYAIKGLWTPALRIYVEGLRPLLSPEHAAGLLAIINGHPNLRRPSAWTVADPMEAEKHYAAGLHWYNEREYAKAEKEFFTAVEQDGQDARYYYYLGLAQLMLGDRDAFEDFEQGARLEHQNRPPRAAVSAALERVQGPARLRLNDVRDRPR